MWKEEREKERASSGATSEAPSTDSLFLPTGVLSQQVKASSHHDTNVKATDKDGVHMRRKRANVRPDEMQ